MQIDCRYCHASVETLGDRQRAADPGLHELPPAGRPQRGVARPDPRQRQERHADALAARPQARGVRVLQPSRARALRRRLRELPRAHRGDGGRAAGRAAQHGLVPRLPPQPASRTCGRSRRSRTWPGSRRATPKRGRARSPRSGPSSRPSTARGATGERRILAQPRRARGHARVARVPRARVPRGRLRGARRREPPHAAPAAGRDGRGGGPDRGVPPARGAHRPLRRGARAGRARRAALLRDDDAERDERLRPGGREPRGPADQGRGQRAAPGEPRLVERARAGLGPRPLRPGPLAARAPEGRAVQVGRLRGRLEGAREGARRVRRRGARGAGARPRPRRRSRASPPPSRRPTRAPAS